MNSFTGTIDCCLFKSVIYYIYNCYVKNYVKLQAIYRIGYRYQLYLHTSISDIGTYQKPISVHLYT